MTSDGELARLSEEKAKSGVFLTVLGYGMGNLKDSTLEKPRVTSSSVTRTGC